MGRRIVLDSDCAVPNLDFPRYLDHAWLLTAKALHARLYQRTVDDNIKSQIVDNVLRVTDRTYLLTLDGRYSWTDGRIVSASEVASALLRGRALGLFTSVRVVSDAEVEIVTADSEPLESAVLASPIFTITPSCRSEHSNRTSTCGPYALLGCNAQDGSMVFGRRECSVYGDRGPSEVNIVIPRSARHRRRLLRDQYVDLSCPLGLEPDTFSTIGAVNPLRNMLTNVGVFLRAIPREGGTVSTDLLCDVAGSIDRIRLAQATGYTFVPMSNASQLFNVGRFDGGSALEAGEMASQVRKTSRAGRMVNAPLEIVYSDFEPNQKVALELRSQLQTRLNIRCELLSIPYGDYVAREYKNPNGLSLELMQPVINETFMRKHWRFVESPLSRPTFEVQTSGILRRNVAIPLLQAKTCLVSLNPKYRMQRLADYEAVVHWDLL